MTSIEVIPLIAAFGFGSIVAAVVGWASAKAVAISNHRQNWINALRDDIAAFLKEVDILHFRMRKIFQGPATTDDLEKQQVARASAMMAYRRIRMRLNMTETPSVELANALNALMTIESNVANPDRMEAVIKASGVVLRQEWIVTKYGMFAGILTMKSKLRFDVIAIVVSIIAIAIAAWAAVIAKSQLSESRYQRELAFHSTIGFEINTDLTQRRLGISIQNVGPGVAILRSITYYVDRRPVNDDEFEAALTAAHLDPSREVGDLFDPDEPLAVGQTIWLIDYRGRSKDEKVRATDFIANHLSVGIYHCSLDQQCKTECSAPGGCPLPRATPP